MATTESKFGSIFDIASRHKQEFEAVRTPLEEHKANVADVRLRFRDGRDKVLSCKDRTTADEERLLELAFECGREVERLVSKFEATRAEAEALYTKATDDIFKALCVECIGVFGIPLVKECLLQNPKAKTSPPLQQQPTPERDIVSREDSSLDRCDGTITVSSRKRKTTRGNCELSSKRNKSAATRSQDLNSQSIQPSISTPSHADKQPRQSARHAGGRSGGVAERRQCHLKSVVPGRIYLTFFKSWCLALLLPTQNLEAVGVSETLASLGLTKDIPECYVYDSQTSVFSWRKEYEDGGELEHRRFYPVMYFDGAEFPARSSVGWVRANNLEEYDVAACPRNLIEHHKQAKLYLEQMRSMSPRWTARPSRGTEVKSVPENLHVVEATNPDQPSSSGIERVQEGYSASGPLLKSPGCEAADATTTGQPIRDCHAISEPASTSGDPISTTKDTAHEAGQIWNHSSMEPSSTNMLSTADVEDDASRNPTQSSRVSNDSPEVSAQMVPSREHDPNGFRSVPPPFPSTTEDPVIVSQPTTLNASIPGRATAVYGYGAYQASTSIDSVLLERLHRPAGAGIPGWDASKLCLPPIRTAWDVNPMDSQPAPTPDAAPPPSPTQPIRAPHPSATLTSFRTLLPSSAGRNTTGGTSGNVTPTTLGVSRWDSPLPARIVELLRPHLGGYEPKPEMFFHNGLYHCILCPREKRKVFARVRILENHFVQKHG